MILEKKYTQIGDEKREYTSQEYAQFELDTQTGAVLKAESDKITAAKELALAKLKALGLTVTDLKALGL